MACHQQKKQRSQTWEEYGTRGIGKGRHEEKGKIGNLVSKNKQTSWIEDLVVQLPHPHVISIFASILGDTDKLYKKCQGV